MVLVLLFQGLYATDALYNEVNSLTFLLPARALIRGLACSFHNYGYYDRGFRIHAVSWEHCLGSSHIFPPSPLPRVQPH
jgi:hypothetical protein